MNARVHIVGTLQWPAESVRNYNARLAGHEGAGNVVRMTFQTFNNGKIGRLLLEDAIKQRPQITTEAIVTGHQFDHLPSRADVLIVKE